MKIASTFPVIGPLFYRRSVKVIAGAVKKGDLQAVRELSAIARAGPDAPARAIAFGALDTLSSQDVIDVFCGEVLLQEDPALEKIATEPGISPLGAGIRGALFVYHRAGRGIVPV